jgi:hypothetical protein
MSDERFDRDLQHVLREVAGGEAAMSLRHRLADLIAGAPPARTLWFTPPLRLSVVVVAAIALLALAILFLPNQPIGPSPSVGPSPSQPAPSVEPSAEPSPSGETIEPTATPPTSTSPAPSHAASAWTGLVWSDPVTPSFVIHLSDLVVWQDAYVAVGEVGPDGAGRGAFLTSPDGLNWTVASETGPSGDRSPHHLAAIDEELVAFSQGAEPLLWTSSDGSRWTPVESGTWTTAWSDLRVGPMPAGWDITQHPMDTGLVDVAATADGVVVIGNSFTENGMSPVLLSSADGTTWLRRSLPAGSPSAMLNSVVAFRGAAVVVGAVGIGPDPSDAEPAAWYSADGRGWTRAAVEAGDAFGGQLSGFEFGPAAAASDGIVACQGSREMTAGGPRYGMGWVSADGRTWRPEADPNASTTCGWTAGDGTRIVSVGPTPFPGTGQVWPGLSQAWVSSDGATWTPLAMSETISDMVEAWWIVPDGVIYSGVQSFWFARASTAP